MTTCLGQLGGSGSNAAGYQCRGSFTIDGRHYNEVIPGNTHRPLGTTVRGGDRPGRPGLISTTGRWPASSASWRVFLLPIVLAAALAPVGGGGGHQDAP